MNKNNTPTNPQAFPGWDMTFEKKPDMYSCGTDQGMSLRDYFAAKALPVIMADWSRHSGYAKRIDFENRGGDADVMAEQCYRLADAMLRAREKSYE